MDFWSYSSYHFNMKILLTIIMCSAVHQECLPPLEGGFYDDYYSCMEQGYGKSLEIVQELGVREINKHKHFIKFRCTEVMYDGV